MGLAAAKISVRSKFLAREETSKNG
jgi:hypothetical protein